MQKGQTNLNRRTVTAGLGSVMLAAGAASASAAPLGTSMSMEAMLDACIDDCLKCHVTCLSMATGLCLTKGGVHTAPAHIRIMLDCAHICVTTADFMTRGSAHHVALCLLCADICDACAKSCASMPGMEACLDTCRACAKSCRDMAKMG